MGPQSLEDRIKDERRILARCITRIKEIASEATPPAVQEIVLAQRAAEDARMRLGVATAYIKEQDPLGAE